MFESAFAFDTPGRRSPLLISLTVQTAVVATLVILPLYYIEQLTILPTMPVPIYVPKLPPMKIISVVREAASAMAPRLTQPDRIFRMPPRLTPLSRIRPDISEEAMPVGPVIVSAIPTDSPLVGVPQFKAQPPAVELKPADKPVVTPSRTRVGGAVQAAKLIHQVKPAYPPLAKQARIQGTVRLEAMIAKDGTIQNLVLAAGHPLLVPSAMDAVRQWRYQPTTLNGERVEVLTQIDVTFTLSQ